MGAESLIKSNWELLTDRYAGGDRFWTLSPSYLVLKRSLAPAIADYGRGRVLDAGAGRSPYKDMFGTAAESYVSLDRKESGREVDITGDIQALPMPDGSFETVFCSQVIEHVPEPGRVMAEFFRVLKSGGHLILSAPHLGYLHNEPDDYYRYTNYGLAHMAEMAGFSVVEIRPVGGLAAYLGHLASTAVLGIFAGVPLLGTIIIALNSLWSRGIVAIDRVFGRPRLFALDFLLVARKP